MRFLEEIKRRNVGRVAILYLIVCWVILEPVHVIFHMLEVPIWTNRLVVILMALGFFPTIVFAWVYEVTPEGLKPTSQVPHGQSIRRLTGRRLDFAIIAVLALALAYFIADKFLISPSMQERIRTEARILPPAGRPAATVPEKSIAVLPFADLSEKKDQEYFADGLSEELIDMLTKIQELRVPARTSSFYFKGRAEDIPTIARRLMVAHVLEGSVRKFGTHLRVTAQLVRADNGYHLWSETYDRELEDLFKVQDDIAGSVVKALKLSILGSDVPRNVPTANSEAHTLYLHALALERLGTSADMAQAFRDLQHALTLDPNFALAWASLAELLTDDSWNTSQVLEIKGSWSDLPAVIAQRARVREVAHEASKHALQANPNLAEAHLAMALTLYWLDWDWPAADAELKKARELDPTSAGITEAQAALANTMGRFEDGLNLATRAVEQDPLGIAYWDMGASQLRLGHLDAALTTYQRLVQLYPSAGAYHYRNALALLLKHDAQAALHVMEQETAPWYRRAGLPLVLDALGRGRDADPELAEALQSDGMAMAYQISYVYAARGDVANAMRWLDHAYELRDTGLLSILHDPMLKNVEREPRFQALLQKMKLRE